MSDFQRAFALFQSGDLAGAERELRELLRMLPGHGDAAHLLAGVLHAKGDIDGAAAQFASAARIAPHDPSIPFNHAQVLVAAGRHEEALAPHTRAVALAPNDGEAALAYGLSLAALNRPAEALVQLERARAAAPRNPAAHYNAGVSLSALERYGEAIAAYDAALALSPRHLDARANRAIAKAALLQMDSAVEDMAAVAAQAPSDPARLRQLGLMLLEADRVEEGRAALTRALALEPDEHARFSLGLSRLAEGDFAGGLPAFEARWSVEGATLQHSAPLWLGEEPIEGKRVLVEGEQGLGDAFLFARFVPELGRRGAEVIVRERVSVQGILQSLPGAPPLLSKATLPPPHDLVVPMGSLPLALAITTETLPNAPYLFAEPDRVARWRGRLSAARRKRVGIAWEGNGGDRRVRRRELPHDALARLLGADADLFSLQMEAGAAGPLLEQHGVPHFGEDVRDFRELAALIACMDLVISVGINVAHLAGAMGAPVWVMLPRPCDWRWMRAGAATPWYPSARLFRQRAIGDWHGLMDEVLAELPRAL